MEQVGIRGEEARDLAEHLLDVYFKTQDYPYTRHHIESFDQFMSQDLPAIIKSSNPMILLQERIPDTNIYTYKTEIFIGGLTGDKLYIGTPTVSLKDSAEVRLLFPNEARLRNLTYSAVVEADIVIRITFTTPNPGGRGTVQRQLVMDPSADEAYKYLARFPLFRIPIMLHSRYCLLHGKPQAFLKEAGECIYDQGGYFIVNGSEKVLITHQEQAFNTLYITPQERDPQVSLYASISCLNPATRQKRRVAFGFLRRENKLRVMLPYIRKPLPVFVLFRAYGIQSDEDILRMIFPDPDDAETKILQPMLHESILEAHPFYDTYSALQYIKLLTKGFGEEHVLDVLYNKTFIHVENRPKARATFLAECVRRILRVKAGIDPKTDRDDTRNQRCLTSGVLTRELFQAIYDGWVKTAKLTIDREYKENRSVYQDSNFANIFLPGTLSEKFHAGLITENIMRAFKGKWSSGSGAGVGEEKTGVIQALSRLSFMDFMSHCRRVVLDFDTGMKLPSPRRLHTSQYGYFCTSETPGGASIGITKNLSMLTTISTATDPAPFLEWLLTRGDVMACDQMTPAAKSIAVPVFLNNGIVGFTLRPVALRDALKVMKWTGCLPATASVGFSARDRRVFIYLDEGRPLRPLIHLATGGQLQVDALRKATTWRDLIMGVHPATMKRSIYQAGFVDPLAAEAAPKLEDYVARLAPDMGVIEYVDPYEMNEAYIANFPEHIQRETTHMEIHPSTIVGLLTSMIPYANYNQSPRNQLSCSQSKQGLSVYSTAFQNRFDNQVHVLCYGQAPQVRTKYFDYLADGQMGYGHNLILAMGSFTGYNQDDGIVMNADSIERGMFRSTCYRSYEAFEEEDPLTGSKSFIGNPAKIPGWTSLRPGLDYGKLDERGVIRVGEMVDETTVLVGRYVKTKAGDMIDSSVTAQVWTRGRVEKLSVTVGPNNHVMVKVRVVQERVPELGDKFCLTPDHEVLTRERGWIGITDVMPSDEVLQMNMETHAGEYVHPSEVIGFQHTGEIYEFSSADENTSIAVTGEHRMIVETQKGMLEAIPASQFWNLHTTHDSYFPGTRNHIIKRKLHVQNPVGYSVHCLTVPSGVFLVRRKGYTTPVWTGNSNRHGQKGTIGMLIRGYDMPRTREGIPVDMIMNPHAIPSRMTVAQLVEAVMGKTSAALGTVGNGTLFMTEGNPMDSLATVLRDQLGMEPMGEELMYDGMSGCFVPSQIFVGNVHTMRLKHMPEDKWNARAEGRREQRTHQPTGGRGAQGGLRIGEMERDAILGHGVSDFMRESLMKRADGYETYVCNGCGTIPIYNEQEKVFICSMCDGPVGYIGDTADKLTILPPNKRSVASFSKVEIPYSFKLLEQELSTYLNMGMRILTDKELKAFRQPALQELTAEQERVLLEKPLPQRVLPETEVPEYIKPEEEATVRPEDLAALGAIEKEEEEAAAAADAAAVAAAAVEVAAAPAAPPANAGQQGFLLQIATPSPAAAPSTAALPPLEEGDFDALPLQDPTAPPQQLGPAPAGPPPGTVNVQTANQPFLIVPMNVGAPGTVAAAPTELIAPPAPGAPATLAVDTGRAAMAATGLPPVQAGGTRRSSSVRRTVGGAGAAPNAIVSVNKVGGSSASSAPPNASIRVNKRG